MVIIHPSTTTTRLRLTNQRGRRERLFNLISHWCTQWNCVLTQKGEEQAGNLPLNPMEHKQQKEEEEAFQNLNPVVSINLLIIDCRGLCV